MAKDDMLTLLKLMLEYVLPTLKLFAFTLLFSIPAGMIVALLKMCKIKPISWLTNIYILIMRGTPLMLQVIVAFYFMPTVQKNDSAPELLRKFLSGVSIRGNYIFWAVLVAFVLNYAAYFAEIFRGGIESIPKGQYEAAGALGFSRLQTFFRIILPQVVKRVIPASSNEVITLVKDTSLANTVGYMELIYIAETQSSRLSSLVPLFMAGVMYFVMASVLTLLFSFIEKKFNYYK